MRIEGSVALVTGGASGIGKSICEHLLQKGAKVCGEMWTFACLAVIVHIVCCFSNRYHVYRPSLWMLMSREESKYKRLLKQAMGLALPSSSSVT